MQRQALDARFNSCISVILVCSPYVVNVSMVHRKIKKDTGLLMLRGLITAT